MRNASQKRASGRIPEDEWQEHGLSLCDANTNTATQDTAAFAENFWFISAIVDRGLTEVDVHATIQRFGQSCKSLIKSCAVDNEHHNSSSSCMLRDLHDQTY